MVVIFGADLVALAGEVEFVEACSGRSFKAWSRRRDFRVEVGDADGDFA